ncbi:MAG: ArsR/SmtB family transcription factor [Candidatus Thorarchaeota archaeon]
MKDDELFEAISHPMRVDILKILATKPTRFADLKRRLKIKSSGLLDFHLKKMDGLLTNDKDGNYALNEQGYAALQAVDVVSKYGWQRRSFFIHICTYLLMVLFMSVLYVQGAPLLAILVVIILHTAWILFYSYWSLVKRKVNIRNPPSKAE